MNTTKRMLDNEAIRARDTAKRCGVPEETVEAMIKLRREAFGTRGLRAPASAVSVHLDGLGYCAPLSCAEPLSSMVYAISPLKKKHDEAWSITQKIKRPWWRFF